MQAACRRGVRAQRRPAIPWALGGGRMKTGRPVVAGRPGRSCWANRRGRLARIAGKRYACGRYSLGPPSRVKTARLPLVGGTRREGAAQVAGIEASFIRAVHAQDVSALYGEPARGPDPSQKPAAVSVKGVFGMSLRLSHPGEGLCKIPRQCQAGGLYSLFTPF